MKEFFEADGLKIRTVCEADLPSTLEVYRQCEDFLSLGPISTASMNMVLADIEHSKAENGIYCGIWNEQGTQIGVLDFAVQTDSHATLYLLMIAGPYRKKGNGENILRNLEKYLKRNYGTQRILSGVQVNNEGAIIFWKRMGFEIINEAKDMGDGTVAYEMTKQI